MKVPPGSSVINIFSDPPARGSSFYVAVSICEVSPAQESFAVLGFFFFLSPRVKLKPSEATSNYSFDGTNYVVMATAGSERSYK